MRLAVFTNQYPAGVATFFERDLRGLLDAGIEVDVFAIHPLDASLWQYSNSLARHPGMDRSRVHHLGARAALRRGLPLIRQQPRRCLGDLARAVSAAVPAGPVAVAKTGYVFPLAWSWLAEYRGQFDQVLAYWGNYAATCAYAFHRLDGRSIPFTIWLHAGLDLYRAPVFLREKLDYADTVLTCCEFNRAFILERFAGVIPDLERRLHVSHHGLDLEEFPFRPDERPPNKVVAVGRLAGHKGFDDLLRAARLVAARFPTLTVELVGDGPERRSLARLARTLGIADRVRFTGWLPFAGARRAMAEATILAHPSDGLGDGLPNVVREAMALGTPVVGSRVAGLPDALEDGCGVLVPPMDPPALAVAIEDLLRDPAARSRIAARARRRVETYYDARQNGARLASLLLTARRSPAVARMPVATYTSPSASRGEP